MLERYIGPEARFSRWFFQTHPEYASNRTNFIVNTLGELLSHEQMMQSMEQCMERLRAISSKDEALGVVIVDYGYSYAAIDSKEGISFVTRQNGFVEAETWPYDITEQLGYNADELEDETEKLDVLMQWIDDPRDKLELFYDIYRKILKRIIRETLDRLGETTLKTLLISLPVLPAKARANWNDVLHAISKEKCRMVIDSHAVCLPPSPHVSTFVFYQSAYNQSSSTLVEVVSQEQGGNSVCDAFFYKKEYESDARQLQTVKQQLLDFTLTNIQEQAANISNSHMTVRQYAIPIVIGRIAGLTAFLKSHAAAFRHSLFTCVETTESAPTRIQEIRSLFRPGEALSAVYICSQLCKQADAASMSLMDMATIYSLLENQHFFQKSNLVTKKEKVRFGAIDDLPLDISAIAQIPSNYSSVGWRCFADFSALLDYNSLGSDPSVFADIVPVLQSIVSHYDYCTTEDVASDLYFIWKRSIDEPSALLTAKVYLLLSEHPSFGAIRSTEPVHKPVYETEQYKPQQKPMEDRKPRSVLIQKPKDPPKPKEAEIDGTITIGDMGLSLRSYNALLQAHLVFARDVCNRSDAELLKVRYLGMRGVGEIRSWQTAHASGANHNAQKRMDQAQQTSHILQTTPSKTTAHFQTAISAKQPVSTVSPKPAKPVPAATKRPKRVISKHYGVGHIEKLISAPSGDKIEVLFEKGVRKTFIERLALQSGTIKYEY